MTTRIDDLTKAEAQAAKIEADARAKADAARAEADQAAQALADARAKVEDLMAERAAKTAVAAVAEARAYIGSALATPGLVLRDLPPTRRAVREAFNDFVKAIADGEPSLPAWITYRKAVATAATTEATHVRAILNARHAKWDAAAAIADRMNTRLASAINTPQGPAARAAQIADINADINSVGATAAAEAGAIWTVRDPDAKHWVTPGDLGATRADNYEPINIQDADPRSYAEALADAAARIAADAETQAVEAETARIADAVTARMTKTDEDKAADKATDKATRSRSKAKSDSETW